MAGDLVRGLLEDRLPVPMTVVRDYRLPAWVGPGAVVVCSSYSGNTEETLSAFAHALDVGARVLVITSGGKLKREAGGNGLEILELPAGIPPRAALGYSLFGLLALVENWDLIPSLEKEVGEALEVLAEGRSLWRASTPRRSNKAKQVAAKIAHALPLLYAPEGATQAVAFRWKTQLNENSKMVAYNCALPELDHNEIVGLKKPFAADRPLALFLRDRREPGRMKDRVEITKDLLKDAGLEVMEAWGRGRGALARMVSLVYLGDYVSAYAGFLRGFDPTPVKVIEKLKKELARRH
jgi:glucose/mannose-6-phosphate isomerase